MVVPHLWSQLLGRLRWEIPSPGGRCSDKIRVSKKKESCAWLNSCSLVCLKMSYLLFNFLE
uniref:Uncharacterized protein n=1 Tax=Astyanax mexicanus TaxID=7994 RepID=A0A3B1JAH4_ASTMX